MPNMYVIKTMMYPRYVGGRFNTDAYIRQLCILFSWCTKYCLRDICYFYCISLFLLILSILIVIEYSVFIKSLLMRLKSRTRRQTLFWESTVFYDWLWWTMNHSGSGKRQAKVLEENYWDCSVCTYRNTAEAFKCLMCDVRKGTSTRKPRINPQLVAQQVGYFISHYLLFNVKTSF